MSNSDYAYVATGLVSIGFILGVFFSRFCRSIESIPQGRLEPPNTPMFDQVLDRIRHGEKIIFLHRKDFLQFKEDVASKDRWVPQLTSHCFMLEDGHVIEDVK